MTTSETTTELVATVDWRYVIAAFMIGATLAIALAYYLGSRTEETNDAGNYDAS